jgi:hypothetical protein
MNLNKLFKTLFVLLFLTGVVSAQTFYVNNVTGNDANPGTQASPKATVSSALLAAPGGSTISVAATGVNYTEATPGMNLLPGPLTPGVTGTYTFTSTGGTPVFTSAFQVGVVAGAAGTLTFTGPFQFNGLTLQNGTLAGGNQVTIATGANVFRTNIGSITSGQLAFAGTANFTYQNYNGAAAITIETGLEFPTATNVANNLTLTATNNSFIFRLNQNRQINGTLNGDGDAGANTVDVNLNGFTLTVSGALAHVIDGNVTSATGTLSFNLTGNASLDGLNAARSITNLTVGGSANTFTLDPGGASTISTVGNVILNNNTNLTMLNTGNIGDITHNGGGLLTTFQTAPGTVGNVLMSSTATSAGVLRLNLAAGGNLTTGTLTQSGQGFIHFGANVTGTVTTGNVLLNSNIALTTAGAQTNRGMILFDNNSSGTLANVQINGTLKNEAVFSGTTDDAGNGYLGLIIFANTTNVTVTGASTVNVTGAVTINAGGTFTGDLGCITFANATGAANFAAITNSSTFSPGAVGVRVAEFLTNDPGTPTSIPAPYITATFAGGFTAGAVTNSSSTDGNSGGIEFDDVTGNFIFASITQTGSTTGGDIAFASTVADAGNLTVNGDVKNERGAAGADIVWHLDGVVVAPNNAETVTVNSILNTGASNIEFRNTIAGAVTINQNVQQTGTGRIRFLNMTTATVGITGTLTVSSGFLEFSGSGAVATGNITVNGAVALTGGSIDFGNDARAFIMNNQSIQIGGNNQNVGFPNTDGLAINTEMRFTQPIPNVVQYITIGGVNQELPLWINVNNVSAIPAPYVVFQSLYGGTGNPGSVYITYTGAASPDALVFNSTFGGVVNTVRLDNVRFYLGKNNPGGVDPGDFYNKTGYSTVNGGFVMMNGNATQNVNNTGAPDAGATFGNFGVDNNALSGAANADVAIINPCTFTNDFYLAEGSIANTLVGWVSTTNVQFNGPAPYPTIYRTEGVFRSAPTFNSLVNVTYYGNDKTSAFEIPAATNRLQNLTVATTNGAQPGFGIVNLGASTTVNGTLTINANQTLFTNLNILTLNGSSAVVNGYLVDDAVAGLDVRLSCPTGTTFTGTGYLPSLEVRAGSAGNDVQGFRGLNAIGLGNDYVWGGAGAAADDFNTTANAYDGHIIFQGGAASSLRVAFTAPVAPPTTNFWILTTAAGATFTLGANAIMGGDITHAAGTIALGGFVLDHQGTAPGITGGALTTSDASGKLLFQTGAPTLTITAGPATIGANVEVKLDGAFLLTGGNLVVNGNLTLADKTAGAPGTDFQINAGLTLTAGGSNVTVGSNCGFSAPGAGTGILLLDAVTPPLTYTTTAATTVANLTVADNVVLAGGVLGSTLTINGNHGGNEFVHTAGDFNIGTANLVFGTGAAGNDVDYNRTGGTYSGTGFFVWNSNSTTGTFTHGPALVLNNLRTTTNLTFISASGVTVNDYLDLDGGIIDHTVAGTGYLTIGDGGTTTVEVDGTGNLANTAADVAATWAPGGVFNFLFTNASSTPNAFTWPTNTANNVTLNTAVGNTVDINPASNKVIAGTLTLTTGTLRWDGGTDISMPTAGQKVVRNVNGALNNNGGFAAGTGTFTAPDLNIDYTGFAAGPTTYATGLEYSAPTIVRDVTLLAMVAPAQTMVQFANARQIAGAMVYNSVAEFAANTTFLIDQTIATTGTAIVRNGVTVTYNGNLVNNGAIQNDNGAATLGNPAGAGTLTVVGSLTGTGTYTGAGTAANPDVLNAGGYNISGLTTLGVYSAMNFTGPATFGNFTVPNAAAVNVAGNPVPNINTSSDLTFTGTQTGTYINLNFTGAANQAVALGGSRTMQNINMNKALAAVTGTVTFTGGNLTLNAPVAAAAPLPGIPAGLLTLGNGIFVMGNAAVGVPGLLTLNLTVNAGGIITNNGYVRNIPWQQVGAGPFLQSHVVGRLGMAIPAGTIGRIDYPVGSINPHYRPAAITFTAGNATIAPTTIIASHVDAAPGGTRFFPIAAGTKHANPALANFIGSTAPYHWLFEATTPLGASQRFDVELNGSYTPGGSDRMPTDIYDTRVIYRFDGDVTQNGWYLSGTYGGNALYIDTPAPGYNTALVRNQNSLGQAIAQRAIFAVGVPTQPPAWSSANPAAVAMNEATAGVLNTDTDTYTATDPDVVPQAITYSYAVTPALPTGATASINSTTGAFSFTPGWNGGSNAGTLYTFTITATKADGSTNTKARAVTVTNSNRAPVWTGTGTQTHTTGTVVQGQTLNLTYVAVDPDGDAITYTRAVAPAPAGANSITGGILSFTPTLADAAGGPYVFTITATDANAAAANTTTTVTVTYGRDKGDVDGDGDVDGIDASLVLQHVVGITTPAPLPLSGVAAWAADVNSGVGDNVIGAYDAYLILYKWNNPTLPFPAKVSAAMGSIGFGRISGENGLLNVPIVLTNTSGVTSAFAEIETGTLEVTGVKMASSDGWVTISNIEEGKIRLAMIGMEPLKDGAIAVISFKNKDKESPVTISGNAVLNSELSEDLSPISVREIPTEFALSQNYPNPFNPTTTIKYALPENARVTLVVYNMLGQVIKSLVDSEQEAGFYTMQWDGTNSHGSKVSSGTYIYRLTAGSKVSTLKMNLLK